LKKGKETKEKEIQKYAKEKEIKHEEILEE
jgi:hypothetical protein